MIPLKDLALVAVGTSSSVLALAGKSGGPGARGMINTIEDEEQEEKGTHLLS